MKRIVSIFLDPVDIAGGGHRVRQARRCRRAAVVVWLLLAVPPAFAAEAGDTLAGPVPAVVEEVIDGDT